MKNLIIAIAVLAIFASMALARGIEAQQVVAFLGQASTLVMVMFLGGIQLLSLGVIASLFTALILSRLIFDYLLMYRKTQTLSI